MELEQKLIGKKAFNLYKDAANMGNKIAQFNLGILYENGIGIKKDIDQAIYWHRSSARQGYKVAQKRLEKLLKIKDNKRRPDLYK